MKTGNLDNFLTIDGIKMRYIDRGQGRPVVMLHGNPTWAFFYRSLIEGLSGSNRVVVPDHIGMGLSDKPEDAAYDLAFHIKNLSRLIEHLGLKDIVLVVHDWGGAIGFGYTVENPENVTKIVVLNSSAFFDEKIPRRIKMCRGALGQFLTRRLNLFARAATRLPVKKLPREIAKEYLRPYDSYQNRIGIYSFLKDIPVEPAHKTRELLDSIESRLRLVKSDVLILWGEKDFCFTKHFYDRWLELFPKAKAKLYNNAGHYILEDAPHEVLSEIKEFITI